MRTGHSVAAVLREDIAVRQARDAAAVCVLPDVDEAALYRAVGANRSARLKVVKADP